MTKEQREAIAEHIRSVIAYDETYEDPEANLPAFRAALELLTDEAEADRVLGARVREAIGKVPVHALSDIVEEDYQRPGGSFSRFIFAVVVAALRGES